VKIYSYLNIRNISFLKFLLGALLFLQVGFINGYAQEWELGTLKLMTSESSSGPLRERMSKGSLSKYSFVGKVGGIAFAAKAEAGPELVGKSLYLDYDKNKPDGERVRLFVEKEEYIVPVPDWIIVPVARYAESEFNAVVSLFGPKQTQEDYDVVYHQAFENTLLGLRLLQADTLLSNLNETWQLPRQKGQVVLGRGEVKPTHFNRIAAERILRTMTQASFQAWILTDEKETVGVSLDKGQVHVTGTPYYYFWTSNQVEYNQTIELYKRRAAEALARNDIHKHNLIVTTANNFEPVISEAEVLTRGMRENTQALYSFNPAVFGAAIATMRYAAFFRYIKAQNIVSWNTFMEKITGVAVEPKVETPTRWPKVR
jgi:hypothetical protein